MESTVNPSGEVSAVTLILDRAPDLLDPFAPDYDDARLWLEDQPMSGIEIGPPIRPAQIPLEAKECHGEHSFETDPIPGDSVSR